MLRYVLKEKKKKEAGIPFPHSLSTAVKKDFQAESKEEKKSPMLVI